MGGGSSGTGSGSPGGRTGGRIEFASYVKLSRLVYGKISSRPLSCRMLCYVMLCLCMCRLWSGLVQRRGVRTHVRPISLGWIFFNGSKRNWLVRVLFPIC